MNKPLLLFSILISTVFGLYSFFTSEVDWDAITYSGINLVAHGFSPEESHRLTYEMIRKETTDSEFQNLISATDYRVKNYESSDVFKNQFYLHESKPLYHFLIYCLTIPDYSLTIFIMKLISAVSGGLLLFLILIWLSKFAGNRAVILGMILMILSGFSTVAKLTNPDALAGLLCLLGSYGFLKKKSKLLSVSVMMAVLLIRPNFAPFFMALFAAEIFSSSNFRKSFFQHSVEILIVIAIPVLLAFISNDYVWWRHFYHAMVEPVTVRNAVTESFNAEIYFSKLFQMAKWQLHSYSPFPVMMLLSALILWYEKTSKVIFYQILFLWCGIVVQFVLFPHPDHRFWMHYSGLISIIFIASFFNNQNQIEKGKVE